MYRRDAALLIFLAAPLLHHDSIYGAWCSRELVLQVGVYPHDPITGKPSTASRLANVGGNALTTTGLKVYAGATIDVVGLAWISVHSKLTGIATAPTWVAMSGANGKHVHSGSGADLAGKSAYQHYSSTDAFTTSPPTPILTTAAVNRALPCPMLLAA